MKTYSDIIDFLRAKHIAVVATVAKDGGAPHSATVFYHLGDVVSASSFSLYFVTRRHTRKFSDLLADQRVSMVVGTELEPFSVQIDGTAEFIEASSGIERLFDLGTKLLSDPQLGMLYVGAFYPNNPFGQIEGEDFAVFRVNPTVIRYMHPSADQKRIEYTQTLG